MADIKAIKLSDLNEIKDPDSFFVFASRTADDGTFESGKVRFDELGEIVKNLQLERRISLTMEALETEMFIGEEMTIYRVEASNVSTLKINNTAVTPGTNIKLEIPKSSIVTFSITRQNTDPKGYLFIYAKAKTL